MDTGKKTDTRRSTAIVYFDIDGTLFDTSRGLGVPASTAEALRRLRRGNVLTALNTGRSAGMIPAQILELGFDAVIAGCGTFISLDGQILLNEIFDGRRTERVLSAFRGERLDVLLEGPRYAYFEEDGFDPDVIALSSHLFEELATLRPFSDANLEINKISYLVFDEAKDRRLRAELADELYFILYPHALREGIPHGFSKASGMSFLEAFLGSRLTSFAIGDSVNDISMLEQADVGIVMGNGRDEAKAAASFVTKALEDDGIWHALDHYGLLC